MNGDGRDNKRRWNAEDKGNLQCFNSFPLSEMYH